MSVTTLGYAEAIRLVASGQPVTRKGWIRSRILWLNNQLVIQHEVNQPGVTPWVPSHEDIMAVDYVPAYFNSKDTTKRNGPVPVRLIRQPIKTSRTDYWPFLVAIIILSLVLIIQ